MSYLIRDMRKCYSFSTEEWTDKVNRSDRYMAVVVSISNGMVHKVTSSFRLDVDKHLCNWNIVLVNKNKSVL